MGFRALERMLVAVRIKQRAANTGFATPALEERPVSKEDGPFLVTNMRGSFLPTRLSSAGTVRFGFSPVPLTADDKLLVTLHRTISAQFPEKRCTSIEEATTRLLAQGLEARTLVLPESWLPEICGPDLDVTAARETMAKQGYVTKIDDLQVLVADLPPEMAFVAAAPALVGVYTRIADFLGVLIFRADRAIVAVTRDLAG
jgi:hypothetical protein